MKYVCNKCLGLFSENNIVRMPFDDEDKYWCKWCHKKWVEDNPHRGDKLNLKKQRANGK